MCRFFGRYLIKKTDYHDMLSSLSALKATKAAQKDEIGGLRALNSANLKVIKSHREEIARMQDSITVLEADIARLQEIEKKYMRLTDRDERGRFVKRET